MLKVTFDNKRFVEMMKNEPKQRIIPAVALGMVSIGMLCSAIAIAISM